MTNLFSKKMFSDITPPAVKRLIRKLTGTSLQPDTGRERGAEWYDKAFENIAAYNCPYYQSHYYFLWCVLVDRLSRNEAKSILDIGCGPGQVAQFLKEKGLKSYFGLDLSPVAIKKAQRLCPDFEFRAENALESTIYSEFNYDTVISLEFLEHVENEISVIKKLKPGTRFLGTVPDFPYPSHVRHFSSVAEVKERYASYFSDFRVDEFRSTSGSSRYFLLEGLKS